MAAYLVDQRVFSVGRTSGLVFPGRSGGAASGWSRMWSVVTVTAGVQGITIHDLRRTFATNVAALGVPIHVTEKILNHVSGSISGVAAIYNRHAYFEEMRTALGNWETRLEESLGAL